MRAVEAEGDDIDMFFAPLVLAASLTEQVDAYVKPLEKELMFSGVVLIARGDKPLVQRAYGHGSFELHVPMKTDARFRIASITKTFTAAAILILAERGKLSLDDPLSKYAPDFPNAGRIRLRHLLLHQSGIGNPDVLPCSDATLADVVANLATKPLLFEPGTLSRYSNGGYAMLAWVIEKVAGGWELVLQQEVFTPLKMDDTTRDAEMPMVSRRVQGAIPGPGHFPLSNAPCQNAGAAWGSGALLSTAADLHRWGRAFVKEKLFRRVTLEHPYGWGVRTYHGKDAVEQSGIMNGFASYLAVYPQDDLYVIVLSNIQTAALTEMGIGLAGIAFGKDVEPLPLPPPSVPWNDKREAWVGRWNHEHIGTFTLIPKDGALYQTWGDAKFGSYVLASGPSAAFNRQENAAMTLDGDELRISWGGSDPETFKRER